MTMTLVSTVTVGAGGVASIDFTGIPQTGTDLVLVVSARTGYAGTGDNLVARFNGDSASNYTYRWLYGNGSSAGSGTGAISGILGIVASGSTATASTFGNASIYIPNYTGSTNKSASCDAVNENNAASATQFINAGIWNNTSAITSISLVSTTSSTIQQYSVASLYTVTKGSGFATVS
jgi:hypothetical protein